MPVKFCFIVLEFVGPLNIVPSIDMIALILHVAFKTGLTIALELKS